MLKSDEAEYSCVLSLAGLYTDISGVLYEDISWGDYKGRSLMPWLEIPALLDPASVKTNLPENSSDAGCWRVPGLVVIAYIQGWGLDVTPLSTAERDK